MGRHAFFGSQLRIPALLGAAFLMVVGILVVASFYRGQDAARRPGEQARPTAAGAADEASADLPSEQKDSAPSEEGSPAADDAARKRALMVAKQLRARDIVHEGVLAAMNKVPRHRFVPDALQRFAYHDRPWQIGHQQTISQPYIVALMTQLADPEKSGRALDVGTGSGYQAAILAELVEKVYSIEILKPLADEARQRLKSLGYRNIEVRHGDGYQGWQEHAPFDVIIVAAAPNHIPQPLVDQLAPGGKLVIPVGDRLWQNLVVIEKQADGSVRKRQVSGVRFVPMTGEALKKK